MKANGYLSLARNYSFVLMLLVFIGIKGTGAYVLNNRYVPEARDLLIRLVRQSFNWPGQTEEKKKYELNISGVDPMQYEVLETNFGNFQWTDRDLPDHDGVLVTTRQDVRIYCEGHPRPWTSDTTVIVKTADNQPIKWNSSAMLQRLRTLLKQTGSKLQLATNLTPVQEADSIRKEIEATAYEQRTAIPGIGLEFRNGIAPWFIALTVLGLVIPIRNLVRRTLLDPDLAIEEPWLLLDGRSGLERIAAGAWTFAIFIAPWVASGCLVAVVTIELQLGGGNLFDLCIAPLILAGGWASLTTTGEILRLRRLRLAKISTIPKPPT